MPHDAKGTFDVKLLPQESEAFADGQFGRLLLDKTFEGDLTGTSKGTMLSFRCTNGSGAGYVALEMVSGTLGGRDGTFVLQHSGTMQGSDSSLTITVVPGSGSGQLVGLSGTFTIINRGKDHLYEFAYTLAASG